MLTTALKAVDEPGQATGRCAGCTTRSPCASPTPCRDSLEQRVLRRAAEAIEEELDADDALTRAA